MGSIRIDITIDIPNNNAITPSIIKIVPITHNNDNILFILIVL